MTIERYSLPSSNPNNFKGSVDNNHCKKGEGRIEKDNVRSDNPPNPYDNNLTSWALLTFTMFNRSHSETHS